MEEEIKINSSNLELIFENLKIIKENRDWCERNGDDMYEKYLSEFVGIYTTITLLGLENRWQKWQIEHLND